VDTADRTVARDVASSDGTVADVKTDLSSDGAAADIKTDLSSDSAVADAGLFDGVTDAALEIIVFDRAVTDATPSDQRGDAAADARADMIRDSGTSVGCRDAGPGPIGPSDPGLQGSPASWTLQGNATIEPSGAGFVDLGWAVIDDASARLSQTFAMPQGVDGCSFALRIVAKDTALPDSGGGNTATFNGGMNVARFGKDRFYDQEICLGDWAYGDANGQSSLLVGLASNGIIDHLGIVPSGACVPPGQVLDGDFSGSGWTTEGPAVIGPYGPMGSPAGYLLAYGGSAMHGHLSVPFAEHLEKAALSFRFRGRLDATWSGLAAPGLDPRSEVAAFWVELDGGGPLDSGLGFHEVRACIPAFLRGRYASLSILAPEPSGGGVIDDLALVSDPSCPPEALIMDGGFEATGPLSWWARSASYDAPDAGPIRVHSGSSALHLAVATSCQFNNASTTITLPALRGGSAGLAVTFWYDTTSLASARLRVSVTGASPVAVPASDAGQQWQQAKVCVPSEGRPIDVPGTVAVELSAIDGLCGLPAFGEAWIDDFEVTTDPACPL
jgi:hypothetical protein